MIGPPDPEAPPRKQVEYTIDTIPLPVDEEVLVTHCNERGQDGWQLLFVTAENGMRLWFMREIL